MGEVYRARDTKLGRDVAVKVLPREIADDADRLERFRREARTLAALSHPNIVTIYSIEDEGDALYMAMELVEGRTLDAFIPLNGASAEDFFRVARPMIEAVGAAHEAGITHRDIKSTNVMIGADGRVKVLDFGLARRGAPVAEAGPESLTQPGMLIGTFPYLSPEHVSGQPSDERSDVFALGVVLYELATGSRPFRGATPPEILASILRDTPPSVSSLRNDLPEALSAAIDGCLEKDPAARTASCAELVAALERAEQETPSAVRSIAVLPFADMSPEKDQAYFCEGIAEEILNALTHVEGLNVASRLSSFRFGGGAADLPEIGRSLKVGAVLDGSIRKAGTRIRVTAHLVDVQTGYDLWSERYDRELEDIFAIQDEIAEHIVGALEVALSTSARRELRKGMTSHAEAYDIYLQARQFFYRGDRENWRRARELFSQAIRIDSSYAVAYAGLADCWSFLFLYAEPSASALHEADEMSRRVAELEPDLAEAHASRGLVLSLLERDEESDAAFETAIRKNPNLFEAYYLYGRASFAAARFQKAAALFEKAHKVRSDDFQPVYLLGKAYRALGRAVEAEAATQLALTMVEYQLGLNPDHMRARSVGAHCLVELGQAETGLSWADSVFARHAEEPLGFYVACAYARARRTERALACLEATVAAGWSHRRWLDADVDLDALRGEPAFEQIRERLGRTGSEPRLD